MKALKKHVSELHTNGVRIRFIGDREGFGKRLRGQIQSAEEKTQDNTGLQLNIAANYGGRWDITQALQRIAVQIERGSLAGNQVTSELVAEYLSLSALPEPDFFIRTGGEKRISNFLLWQLAYSELYFTDILWPDFDSAAFEIALMDFANRQRRFGKTSEQVEEANA